MSAKQATDTGVCVDGTAAQLASWAKAAGERPLPEWMAELADQAADADDEPVFPLVVELKQPIDLGSKAIESITIQQGRLGLIRGMKLSGELDSDQLLTLASRMTGQPSKVIDALCPADSGKVMPHVLRFFGECLGGGKTSSR